MKKLERMDGKLFESLKENELSKLSHLTGGYETIQTQNGGDTKYLYMTWSNTRDQNGVHKDNEHVDSEKIVQTNGGSGQPSFGVLVTESITLTESFDY